MVQQAIPHAKPCSDMQITYTSPRMGTLLLGSAHAIPYKPPSKTYAAQAHGQPTAQASSAHDEKKTDIQLLYMCAVERTHSAAAAAGNVLLLMRCHIPHHRAAPPPSPAKQTGLGSPLHAHIPRPSLPNTNPEPHATCQTSTAAPAHLTMQQQYATPAYARSTHF
jgi:hypothetical protein